MWKKLEEDECTGEDGTSISVARDDRRDKTDQPQATEPTTITVTAWCSEINKAL